LATVETNGAFTFPSPQSSVQIVPAEIPELGGSGIKTSNVALGNLVTQIRGCRRPVRIPIWGQGWVPVANTSVTGATVTAGSEDHACSVKKHDVMNTVRNNRMKNLFVLKYSALLITWKVDVFMSDHFSSNTNSSRTDLNYDTKIRKKVAL
jgi:hypothetical protein